jgi:hypothetical protein
MSAAGLGAGILGSRILANQVQRFLPALPAAAEPFVGPLITAASGIGLGMVANFLPIRGKAALSKNLMIGGFVAAALPILENIGRSVGLLSDYVQLQGYRDYVQLQGLGRRQVESGALGLGTQAQAEPRVLRSFSSPSTTSPSRGFMPRRGLTARTAGQIRGSS